jgi:hypothetical protein
MDITDWPSMLPMVQSLINTSPARPLQGHSPYEVMFGRTPTDSMSILFFKEGVSEVRSDYKVAYGDYVISVTEALTSIHKDVKQARQKQHEQNDNEKLEPREFYVGDFVLVYDHIRKSKMSVRWQGPFQVVDIVTEQIFLVKHLITGTVKEVHYRRI